VAGARPPSSQVLRRLPVCSMTYVPSTTDFAFSFALRRSFTNFLLHHPTRSYHCQYHQHTFQIAFVPFRQSRWPLSTVSHSCHPLTCRNLRHRSDYNDQLHRANHVQISLNLPSSLLVQRNWYSSWGDYRSELPKTTWIIDDDLLVLGLTCIP